MSRWRVLLWPGLAAAIALGILVLLGSWQLTRRAEKETMLAALNQAITATPKPIAEPAIRDIIVTPAGRRETSAQSWPELTRVQLSGTFISARSIPVRATLPATKGSPVSGIGFFWMTPLQLENGSIVFINRGFVPSGGDWKAPPIPTPEGPQVITGLLRAPEARQTFMPQDNPAKGEYFVRDPKAMGSNVSLAADRVANLFVDAEREAGSATPPVGVDAREMIARIPNNHLQYAGTWFGLALTLIGVFGFFARGRLKGTA
jgi:surfeit locus 1 family protein